jgi:hypothetical protein
MWFSLLLKAGHCNSPVYCFWQWQLRMFTFYFDLTWFLRGSMLCFFLIFKNLFQ